MSLTITHNKVDTQPDDPAVDAAGGVVPSDWNDDHAVVGVVDPDMIDENGDYVFGSVTATGISGLIHSFGGKTLYSYDGFQFGTLTNDDLEFFVNDSLIGFIMDKDTGNVHIPFDFSIGGSFNPETINLTSEDDNTVFFTNGTFTILNMAVNKGDYRKDFSNVFGFSFNGFLVDGVGDVICPSTSVIDTNSLTTATISAASTFFTGTAGASFEVTLPVADASIDGMIRSICSDATRVSTTWISSGATFQGAPSTLTADVPVRLQYTHATTKWRII